MNIHPTAIVHPKAKLGKNITIGPYSIIEEGVAIGDHAILANNCLIRGNTIIGDNCQFFSGAVIGSIPQDKKFLGNETVFLHIGHRNIFREYTTINPGTGENGKTIIGHDNLFMAYAHVAHDCVVGNGCVLANSAALAGHVTLEDGAVMGGLAAVHQFVRLGRMSIMGGCSKAVQDIPPFSTCDGHPAKIYGVNSIGLRRAKMPVETINSLRKAFKILFFSEMTRASALEKIKKEFDPYPELEHLLSFIAASQRGLAGPSSHQQEED